MPAPTQRPLAEARFAAELEALAAFDSGPRPAGWRLSPRAVLAFITGRAPLPHPDGSRVEIHRKFYGDDALVERAIVTLTTSRGLLLVGEPGTAKSLLSELLAAAISGDSTLTVQGSAATTEDQIRYGWNYALLLARGPCAEALVPGPLFRGMRDGRIVRFEEITRCPPEVADALLGALSERLLSIPELSDDAGILHARPGFNVIATANTRDRGVHEMSAALKRRFNFETVAPLPDAAMEAGLVMEQANLAFEEAGAPIRMELDVATLLATTFHELRAGATTDGERLDRPSTAMSTAEAVAVATSSGLHAHWFGDASIRPDHVARHLSGAVLKDDPDDRARLAAYFNRVVRRRAADSTLWKAWFEARTWLG